MSAITKEFTKEQLIEQAKTRMEANRYLLTRLPPESATVKEVAMNLAIDAIALASLEAQAAGFIVRHKGTGKFGSWLHPKADWFKSDEYEVLKAYTAPPAPVSVPDEVSWEDVPEEITEDDMALASAWAHGFNQCRSAMLQGVGGNSPVTPDGWVMVPAEPTAEMLQSGISAHYERSQIQIHDRPAPGPMECAYVAMLAAAPQQGVK